MSLSEYFKKNADYESMMKYSLMAIEKDNIDAMIFLAEYYEESEDHKNVSKYYLMAIDKGNSDAMRCLAIILGEIKITKTTDKILFNGCR